MKQDHLRSCKQCIEIYWRLKCGFVPVGRLYADVDTGLPGLFKTLLSRK